MEARPIVVVCWLWKPFEGYRSKFTAEHVNVFARMVRRHSKCPVEVVCITDDATGIVDCDRTIPLWVEFSKIRSPADRAVGPQRNPSCYRRLRMFAKDAAEWLGPRIVSMDIDCVITGDITPLLQRREAFLAWGDTNPKTFYNGGLIMFDAGARTAVYEIFKADPAWCIELARARQHFGSDQGWISACLGPKEAKLSIADGVYSYRNHIKNMRNGQLPPNARIVMFHGAVDPWHPEAQAMPWVRKHWC